MFLPSLSGALIVSKLVVQAVLSQLATQAPQKMCRAAPTEKEPVADISNVSSTEGTYGIQVSYHPFISKCPVEFKYMLRY